MYVEIFDRLYIHHVTTGSSVGKTQNQTKLLASEKKTPLKQGTYGPSEDGKILW